MYCFFYFIFRSVVTYIHFTSKVFCVFWKMSLHFSVCLMDLDIGRKKKPRQSLLPFKLWKAIISLFYSLLFLELKKNKFTWTLMGYYHKIMMNVYSGSKTKILWNYFFFYSFFFVNSLVYNTHIWVNRYVNAN